MALDVFISYRREGALDLAGRLNDRFTQLNITSFFDVEVMKEGKFNEQLYHWIDATANFILILPPHAMDRCSDPEDWLRKEIKAALNENPRPNIVPIFLNGFTFPHDLPDDIQEIAIYEALNFISADFEDSFNKLMRKLKDRNGEPLSDRNKKDQSNVLYESNGMSESENRRIHFDHLVAKSKEKAMFDAMLQGKKDIVVFNPAIYDIDCAMDTYNHPEISQVIGWIYNQAAVEEGKRKYPEDRLQLSVGSFESDDLDKKLPLLLEEHHLPGFDLVDLTLILKDCSHPFKKFQSVVDALNPKGAYIFVRELDDGLVTAYPDYQGLFAHMMEIVRQEKYAGSRIMGRRIYNYLRRLGASQIVMDEKLITTANMDSRRRRNLFETYFSYIPEEYEVLLQEDPNNLLYQENVKWLRENYEKLEQEFRDDDFFFSAGFLFFYAYFDSCE
jgi:hypothetical protein